VKQDTLGEGAVDRLRLPDATLDLLFRCTGLAGALDGNPVDADNSESKVSQSLASAIASRAGATVATSHAPLSAGV
jgi:hypothetical protein